MFDTLKNEEKVLLVLTDEELDQVTGGIKPVASVSMNVSPNTISNIQYDVTANGQQTALSNQATLNSLSFLFGQHQ